MAKSDWRGLLLRSIAMFKFIKAAVKVVHHVRSVKYRLLETNARQAAAEHADAVGQQTAVGGIVNVRLHDA